jgi:hypothetical protein
LWFYALDSWPDARLRTGVSASEASAFAGRGGSSAKVQEKDKTPKNEMYE